MPFGADLFCVPGHNDATIAIIRGTGTHKCCSVLITHKSSLRERDVFYTRKINFYEGEVINDIVCHFAGCFRQ